MSVTPFSAIDISASGMRAERLRMEVVANNIANAQATRSADGGPYRRQHVVFATALQQFTAPGSNPIQGLSGVSVVGIQPDMTQLPLVYNPGHPDADAQGMVQMPNVQLASEMVDLITASRGYEANLQALRTYREMAEQSLTVLRGGR